DGNEDLLDAAPDPLLEQVLVRHPEAVERGRLVADWRPLEPGAHAVDLLVVLGDRARRQPAADATGVARQARTAVGIEQARRAARLATGDVAIGIAPVVARARRGQRTRLRRGR